MARWQRRHLFQNVQTIGIVNACGTNNSQTHARPKFGKVVCREGEIVKRERQRFPGTQF